MFPLNVPIASWYVPFFYPRRYKNIYGGRGSGKSHHAAINAIARCANLFRDPDNLKHGLPYYPYKKVRILSGREFNTTIETSVKVVLEEKIFTMGLGDQFIIKNEEIVHRELGSKIIFKGLGRNIQNIRSAESLDICWLEEAQFLSKELMDILIPTVRHEHYCSITGMLFKPEFWTVWNPENRGDWVWVRFVERPREDDLSLHVNYMHNPFLPTISLEEALASKEEDINEYNYIWEGQPNDTGSDKQILPYQFVKACLDAWPQRPDTSERWRTDMGFDIALGGEDNCAVAVRTGPIVHDIKYWNGEPDLNALALKASTIFKSTCDRLHVKPRKIYYDGNHPMLGAFRATKHVAPSEPVLFGGAVEGPKTVWEKKTNNKEMFSKRNIQMAIALRLRAARTKRLLDGADVDPAACLFINPKIKDISRITGVLTQPVRRTGMTGKLEIDKRGLDGDGDSPDEFDALCLAFHNDVEGGLRARD